eukprot:PITA_14223
MLKGTALQWFMRLGGSSITTWEEMRTAFLEKYQDYCKSWDIKEETFKFTQKEDENMEDYVECFKYMFQILAHSDLDKDILKIILLRAFREDSLELLNIVEKGDISKEEFDTICELCIQCSRGVARNKQGIRSTKPVHPQFPIQPNLNTNNKWAQKANTLNLPSYNISPAEFYDMHLRSRRTVDAQPSPVIIEQIDSEEKEPEIVEGEPNRVNRNHTPPQPLVTQKQQAEPPYPKRLAISKPTPQAEFDLLGELQNLFVKIPLLQAMRDVPIYEKPLREYCAKKTKNKSRDPLTIHVMGKLSNFMMGRSMPVKYGDPQNPIFNVQINGVEIPNVLVDLGVSINVITTETMHALGLRNLKHTPTVLELTNRSTVKLVRKLEDIMISVDSWHYPVDFLVLQTQSPAGGHPLILGRPWLAIIDAYIGCRYGHMIISNGQNTKNLVLYPPTKPNPLAKTAGHKKSLYNKEFESENEELRPVLTIGQALQLKSETEDDAITTFISYPCSMSDLN